jgi:hypothetical protein
MACLRYLFTVVAAKPISFWITFQIIYASFTQAASVIYTKLRKHKMKERKDYQLYKCAYTKFRMHMLKQTVFLFGMNKTEKS